jgi:hypothetical protein
VLVSGGRRDTPEPGAPPLVLLRVVHRDMPPQLGAPADGGALALLGTELSLSSRGRMTLGVGEIFWFISHTLPQCHTLQGVGDTYL